MVGSRWLSLHGRRVPPTSQDGKTFLRNHAACVPSIELFVVRSISFTHATLISSARWAWKPQRCRGSRSPA